MIYVIADFSSLNLPSKKFHPKCVCPSCENSLSPSHNLACVFPSNMARRRSPQCRIWRCTLALANACNMSRRQGGASEDVVFAFPSSISQVGRAGSLRGSVTRGGMCPAQCPARFKDKQSRSGSLRDSAKNVDKM